MYVLDSGIELRLKCIGYGSYAQRNTTKILFHAYIANMDEIKTMRFVSSFLSAFTFNAYVCGFSFSLFIVINIFFFFLRLFSDFVLQIMLFVSDVCNWNKNNKRNEISFADNRKCYFKFDCRIIIIMLSPHELWISNKWIIIR